jgi:hypothetical protein
MIKINEFIISKPKIYKINISKKIMITSLSKKEALSLLK